MLNGFQIVLEKVFRGQKAYKKFVKTLQEPIQTYKNLLNRQVFFWGACTFFLFLSYFLGPGLCSYSPSQSRQHMGSLMISCVREAPGSRNLGPSEMQTYGAVRAPGGPKKGQQEIPQFNSKTKEQLRKTNKAQETLRTTKKIYISQLTGQCSG